jgi:hypothetical protein
LLEGEDTNLAFRHGVIADDIDYDEQRAKGIMHAHADPFSLARSNSTYKASLTVGLGAQSELLLRETAAHPALCRLLNKVVYKDQLQSLCERPTSPFPPFAACHIKGQVELTTDGPLNLREAQAVIEWIREHFTEIKGMGAQGACVVTTSVAQCKFLEARVPSHLPVFCLQTMPANAYQWVIFSPAVTAQSPRPFLFDSTPNLLYKAVSRATESIMLFADLDIFDTTMNTPSGQLARSLFASEDYSLKTTMLPLPKTNSKQVSFDSFAALRSQLDQFVQKASHSIIIKSSMVDPKTLEAWRLTGDLNKAIGRQVSIVIETSRAVLKKMDNNKVLQTWKKAGVNIVGKPNCHNNAIFIDDCEAIELNFPLLAVTNEDFPVQTISYEAESLPVLQKLLGQQQAVSSTTEVLSDLSDE